MPKQARKAAFAVALVTAVAAALSIIAPALAITGDYGVNTGSDLNDSQSPTSTPVPPTPVPPTPVPQTPVLQATPTCAPS